MHRILEPAGVTDKDRYQHTNTIRPESLREGLREDLREIRSHLQTCDNFNASQLTVEVGDQGETLVFSPSPYEDFRGRIEVTFQRDTSSPETNPMFFADYHLWAGGSNHASHRHILIVNHLVIKPWSEWYKFRSGPYHGGSILHLSLAFDLSIPALLHWEQEALEKVERIDRALGKHRLKLYPEKIEVSQVQPPCEDCDDCKITTDAQGGGVAIRLPDWFNTGNIVVRVMNRESPCVIFKGGTSKPVIPLTPRKLLGAGFKSGSTLIAELSPDDPVWFG
ncbi:MAG: hypothetical protein KBC15_01190 [Candidatus Levybacteria bacterium]|nr:hypothetical protein [Candidatus Levybacteria bacterium]